MKNKINKTKLPFGIYNCLFNNILLIAMVFLVSACLFVPPVQAQTDALSNINFSGDFRLRYENTNNLPVVTAIPDLNNSVRHREVVRFRAGANKQINNLLNFGVRFATGSSDDPNTADVTLGSFVNDLEVSLDRVYLEFKYQDLYLAGGKFANPFLRTDLVWDGDVNPQGVAGSYTFSKIGKITPKFIGVYSIIDEQTIDHDSYMFGGQMQFAYRPATEWNFTLAGAFYNYTIRSLSHADAGDWRSNFLNPNGDGYLSDFDLANAIAIVEYRGFGESYPIRIVGDFVKNTHIAAELRGEDEGLSLDFFVGRASKKKDIRVRYGYSEAETDAVFAAFSNDNTTIPTNYIQHTVTFDYVALENTMLNLTWYLHRRKEVINNLSNDFISRLRLNVMVNF